MGNDQPVHAMDDQKTSSLASIVTSTSLTHSASTTSAASVTTPSTILNTTPIDNRISNRVTATAAQFWQQHIDSLIQEDKLEIGCSVFFGLIAKSNEFKSIMKKNANNIKIEIMSIKYLDMMGWLIRYLARNNQDNKMNVSTSNNTSYLLLIKLGQLHKTLGVSIKHFEIMLQSLHETFAYYFPQIYNIQVKYSIDVIFTVATQIMMQQNLNKVNFLNDITKLNCKQTGDNLEFLQSLEKCLKSPIGREYFYGHLQQSFCDEIAIYLQLMSKFHLQTSDTERFMIARNIIKTSIHSNSVFAVNISFECRQSTTKNMKQFEQKYKQQQSLHNIAQVFDGVEMEMRRLIIKNHWKTFVEKLKNLN